MSSRSRKPAEAAPNPIRALAKLPVFYDLAGKRVVMAGGTAAAAWKAELLAASGANVHVYAVELEPEMVSLLERGAADGHLTHHQRPWAVDIFAATTIALADAETNDEARAFYCAAVAAGVPVNVIDKPAYCQFQFGSIVNRSPVVVSISTDGAAPILGQAVRRRIETLLPPALAEWGAFAKAIRARVTEALAPGSQRRVFWERLADKAFGVPPQLDSQAEFETLIRDTARGTDVAQGRVTLVGAGPGDPDLLTLKAVRALQAADVIMFDDLVSDVVLELARREAKRMMVGKRGGRESCSQDDINAMMLTLAKQGKRVVRLKSGDPMVFGRAGEEIAMLEAAGVPVSVVPGITAASAMASSHGLSLTHRDHAQSVRFVTGHSRKGELPADLDWPSLANGKGTLVFYMAGRTAPGISKRLLDEGLSPQTPVVVATSVSRPDQQVRRTTLQGLGRITSNSTHGPVLIGIGDVFSSDISQLQRSAA